MKKICLCCTLLFIALSANTQPYIDIVSASHTNSPDASLWKKVKNANKFYYYNFSTTLPIQLKQRDYIILSPFVERWSLKFLINNTRQQKTYHGIALPVSYLKNISNRWSLLLTSIVRVNDSVINTGSMWQMGGAAVANYKKNEKLTYKFGFYLINEFFGLFGVPLLGIDWRIDKHNNLFGLLPGKLTFEHRLTTKVSLGANFRALTNSYGAPFLRIDENQLGIFTDLYIAKKIALSVEGGHSLFRQLRLESIDLSQSKYVDAQVNDNFYWKLGLSYRIRLDD